jgi:hypothetical protein
VERFGFEKPAFEQHMIFVSDGTTRALEVAELAEQNGFANTFVLDGMSCIVIYFALLLLLFSD